VHHPTVRVFMAGGVPEVMLHLRGLNLLDLSVTTVSGQTLGTVLDHWEKSARRQRFRKVLQELDGVEPDDVILPPDKAKARGLTSTVTFPAGNIAPDGAVIKSTSIDPSVVGPDGVYRHEGPVKFFTSEALAMQAIRNGGVAAGDVIVLAGCGPAGTGMEETYQLTSALKHLPFGKHVALITDARFSGVSTGACIGHAGPEALAGGPIGKLRDGDIVRIEIDRAQLTGRMDFIGTTGDLRSPEEAAALLHSRSPHPDLKPHPLLPDDTRLWAALQAVSGGTWGGCVYDAGMILERLKS
jgi:dihydroxyacid dehydratase/phosphogluconate dehydratase